MSIDSDDNEFGTDGFMAVECNTSDELKDVIEKCELYNGFVIGIINYRRKNTLIGFESDDDYQRFGRYLKLKKVIFW